MSEKTAAEDLMEIAQAMMQEQGYSLEELKKKADILMRIANRKFMTELSFDDLEEMYLATRTDSKWRGDLQR
jgi:hypothetical protein